MSASQRKPKVRMLWVAINGVPAVYEGQGSWLKCVYWMKRLSHIDTSSREWMRTRQLFVRNQYVTFREVRASLHDLESFGFQRADQ
jgi:hypothetical protein